MIHKVNRPEFRLVVNSTKSAENDPGSSQGNGVAYEKLPPQSGPSDSEREDPSPQLSPPPERNEEKNSQTSDNIELGNLILELKTIQKVNAPRPGLTVHYQKEDSHSKGILLNKKAE